MTVGQDVNTFRDGFIINTVAFLRSFGVGLMGVVLGIYLSRLGYSAFRIGTVIAIGLAGSAIAIASVGIAADWIGRKRFLVALSLLTALSGLGLSAALNFPFLLVFAFVGMLNGTGTERSAVNTLEQAVIPSLGPDTKRTWNLAVYNLLIDGGGSIGALAAGLPLVLQHHFGPGLLQSYKILFLGYSALYILVGGLYLGLSPAVEVKAEVRGLMEEAITPGTKKAIRELTALFSMDAFGGGFLTDALVSFWFFKRFGLSEQDLGLVFFVIHLLNALSHLGAAWLASRIGLVKTMVFTHLPSSLLLMTVPFATSAKVALALFFAREALVEMDVPTRQSYVASLVPPSERSFASSVTNVARVVGWAVGSGVAGVLMQHLAFSAPLVVGGGTKITYDVLLYKLFRRLKPPEEIEQT